jgi:Malectin domain
MQPRMDFEPERLELAALLTSGIFGRAPNLALVLNYTCARYFDGAAEQIKEYNIAVEALGRPANFDQRSDSIVRVEAHRLRKRLREYYEGEGANHAVQIEIPPGQYAPRFVHRNPPELAEPALVPAADPAPATEPAPVETVEQAAIEPPLAEPIEIDPVKIPPAVPPPAPSARRTPRLMPWIVTASLAIAAMVAMAATTVWRRAGTARSVTGVPAAGVPPVQQGDIIRIRCGLDRSGYIDRLGNAWSGDMFFQGGAVLEATDRPIQGTRDAQLYRTRREGAFRYDIPLKPGVYEMRLYFAETVYGDDNPAGGGETSRVFTVRINGKEILTNFDVVADVGASTADIKVFKDIAPAADGKLHLQFEPVSNQPILNGIEISPGMPGRMRAVRMVAQEHGYTDKSGRYWEPDRYVRGGQLVSRHETVSGDPDPDLYRGERFGNISYTIPVADGRYTITLHFAETWFGPGKTGGGPGPGSRTFDILCNGVAVKRNFDIFKEAGGADRAMTLSIPDIAANHQGKIVVSLVPVNNYASVNAIELVDASR